MKNNKTKQITKVALLLAGFTLFTSCDKKSEDVTINKDGIEAEGVTIDEEGIETGDITINKEGIETDDVKINKEGVETGDVKINKEGVQVGDLKISKDGIKGLKDIKVSDSKTWPKEFSGILPEFKKGDIALSNVASVGGINTIAVEIDNASVEDFKSYVGTIDTSDFGKEFKNEDEDEVIYSYSKGATNLSLNYNKEEKKVQISYVGKK